MGGEHVPRMFYAFYTETKYKDCEYEYTAAAYPGRTMYYCCVLKSKTFDEMSKEIAEYEKNNKETIEKFNAFAKSKREPAPTWMLGLWGEVQLFDFRPEEDMDDDC
jgi:hypothetical protein